MERATNMLANLRKTKKQSTQEEIMLKLSTIRQQIYSPNVEDVISEVKNKEIVLFVGNTKCGKSTIVNYIIGNKLEAVKDKSRFHISKHDKSPGPDIGLGASSHTTLPRVYFKSKIDGLVVDAPGFDDNRGEVQDVVNSFYIKEFINNAGSLKLALVTDIIDITSDNIGHFIGFIDKICLMLPHNGNLHKGMVMVFNKDNDGYTREEIGELFQKKILNQTAMQINNEELVVYLQNHLNQIVIVKMPKTDGIIDESEVFVDLIYTINNNVESISKREMSVIVPGISDKSRAFLLEAHIYLTEMKEFDELLDQCSIEFRDSLTKYDITKESGSSGEAKKLNTELFELEKKIDGFIKEQENPISKKLEQLKLLAPRNTMLEQNSVIHTKIKFVSFIDGVLNIKESEAFNLKIKGTFLTMYDLACFARLRLQERMMDITQEEATERMNKIIEAHKLMVESLEKQINELKAQNQDKINKQCEELGILARAGKIGDEFISKIGDAVSGWFAKALDSVFTRIWDNVSGSKE